MERIKLAKAYKIHLKYCKDKGLTPVKKTALCERRKKGMTDKKAIFTPSQGHGGVRERTYYTIKDDWREWKAEHNIEISYQTYRYNMINKTLDRKLEKCTKTYKI